MIDFAETGAAVLMRLGKEAVILDAKAADFARAGPQIFKRVDLAVEIIHDIAGIVVDLDVGMIDFAGDTGAGGSSAGFAAVLFDDKQYVVIATKGGELLEAFDP